MNLDRRRFINISSALGLTSGLIACSNSGRPSVQSRDISTSAKQFEAYIKLIGSQARENVYVSFGGVLWGIRPELTPEPICGFQGLARSDWRPNPDGSYTKTSFDIGYFSDLETDEPLEKLVNPLTGETVEPFRFKYGGAEETLNLQKYQEKSMPNQKWTVRGKQVWMTERSTGEFPAPLLPNDWPRESAGDLFRFGSETSYASTIAQLADPSVKKAPYSMFWSSMISWEPWLLMDGAAGFNMWRGVGSKLATINDVPERMRQFIAGEQSNYFDDGPPWTGRASTYADFKLNRKPQ